MARVTDINHARVLRELVTSLKRAGWSVQRPHVSPDGLGGPTVYLYDAETRFGQSIIYPIGALELISQESALLKATFEDKCIFLDGLLGELSNHSSELPLRELHTLLKIAAGAYLQGTQIYKTSRIDGAALQYLVVRSPHTSGHAHLLCPSRVMTPMRLTPEELEQCALNLLTGHVLRTEQPIGRQDSKLTVQGSQTSPVASPIRSGPFDKPRPRR